MHEAILKQVSMLCASSQGLPSGETHQPEPNLLSVFPELPDLGEGKYQLQPNLTVLPTWGAEKLRGALEGHSPEAQAHWKTET